MFLLFNPQLLRFFYIMVHVANDVCVARWVNRRGCLWLEVTYITQAQTSYTKVWRDQCFSKMLSHWQPIIVLRQTSSEVWPKLTPHLFSSPPIPSYSSRKLADESLIVYDLPSHSFPSIFKHYQISFKEVLLQPYSSLKCIPTMLCFLSTNPTKIYFTYRLHFNPVQCTECSRYWGKIVSKKPRSLSSRSLILLKVTDQSANTCTI